MKTSSNLIETGKFNIAESSVAEIMNAQMSFVIPKQINGWFRNFLLGEFV